MHSFLWDTRCYQNRLVVAGTDVPEFIILILAVQPYKKSYMNVMDGLLLALMGFLTLLIVTFLYIQPSAKETLPLIFVIACGLPQLVRVLSVIYRQLKGNQVARYIAGKVCTLVKQILKQNKAGDELSDANPLHHQMINPNHYNRLLLSDTEQACISSETHSVPGKVPLMVQSAYPTEVDFIQDFCNILAVILCIFYCYEHLSSYGVMLCNYGLSCCNISI